MSFLTHPEPEIHIAGAPLGRSYTPDACARAVLARLRQQSRIPFRARMLEPCVGGGAFVRAARDLHHMGTVVGFDIDPGAPGLALCDVPVVGDARDPGLYQLAGQFDLSASNYPFGKAVGQETTLTILQRSRRAARVTVAVLPNDYQTQAGFEPHLEEAAAIWPLLPRPFENERGMCAYVWDRTYSGQVDWRLLRWRAT